MIVLPIISLIAHKTDLKKGIKLPVVKEKTFNSPKIYWKFKKNCERAGVSQRFEYILHNVYLGETIICILEIKI